MAGPDAQPGSAVLGQRADFRRVLRPYASFAIAFSVVSITTGIFVNYGVGLQAFGPASIWLWPVATAGQLLVALVFAELSTRIPLAGAGYQWAARLIGPGYGWFVGALGVLYVAVGVPAILLIGAAPLLASELGLDAADRRVTLGLALGLLLLSYLVNLISVELASRINNVAVVTEIVGTLVFALLLLGLWLAGTRPGLPISMLTSTRSSSGATGLDAIVPALLVGVFTLVGFEAAADMGEETVDAPRTLPRAILLAVVSSGVIGMAALVGFTVAIPDLPQVQASAVPLVTIAEYWLGAGLTKVFIAVVVFSMIAVVIVSAAAGARLLFAMARDHLLPGSATLRRVVSRARTPLPALGVGLGLNLLLLLYGGIGGNAFDTLVASTAIVPYLIYLLILIAFARRRRSLEAMHGDFSLGRWAVPVMVAALVWLAAVVLVLVLAPQFRSADYVVVAGLVLTLAWYLAALRRRIQRGEAGPASGEAA